MILAPPSGRRPGADAPPPAPPSLRHCLVEYNLNPNSMIEIVPEL